MPQKILITGGAGFIGSNIAMGLTKAHPGVEITCLDNLVRKGSEFNARRLENAGITMLKIDIRDRAALLRLPPTELIIDCCADPSVLSSFEDPTYTLETNLIGTMHTVELARRDKADLIFLSTSRVYPVADLNALAFQEKSTRFEFDENLDHPGASRNGINEAFPLIGPKSLYGVTKLCSEQLIQEFSAMNGFRCVINRLGVIAGPWQMGKVDQGLLAYWIARHIYGGDLSYIGYKGSGKQVRDFLHVEDLIDLVITQITQLDTINGQVFNVGGGERRSCSLSELTDTVRSLTGQSVPIRTEEQERRADVRIYYTDNTKVSAMCGWSPQRTIGEIVEDTHRWILDEQDTLAALYTS